MSADHHEEEEEDELMGLMSTMDAQITDEQTLERERMKLLLGNFDDGQMARYEAFRRSNVNRNAVKKLANAMLNQSITANVSVALSGMSKVLIGEIVERARDIQFQIDGPPDDGINPLPLRPEHLREAWRQYKRDTGAVPGTRWKRVGDAGRLFH